MEKSRQFKITNEVQRNGNRASPIIIIYPLRLTQTLYAQFTVHYPMNPLFIPVGLCVQQSASSINMNQRCAAPMVRHGPQSFLLFLKSSRMWWASFSQFHIVLNIVIWMMGDLRMLFSNITIPESSTPCSPWKHSIQEMAKCKRSVGIFSLPASSITFSTANPSYYLANCHNHQHSGSSDGSRAGMGLGAPQVPHF